MSFNKSDCIIRKLYCGDKRNIPQNTNDKKYSRKGTSYECLQKGFGMGDWQQRKKNLSKTNLQQITYIGPVYESNFRRQKICTTTNLIKKMQNLPREEKIKILHKGCRKKDGCIDQRALNAVILFLHEQGVQELPECMIFEE